MKKLLILNTEPREYSYGGVCPFMRNMHPYLAEAFEVEYMTLPERWQRMPGSTRVKYLLYLWWHRRRMAQYDCILSHGPEGSFVASYSGVPYVHIYHGNSNPMSISRFWIGKYFARMYDKMFARIDATCPLVYTVGPARNDRQHKLYNPLEQNVTPLPTTERKGFIFAGRLEAMKNVDQLIQIYAKLPEDVQRENPFYIAGYGTQEEALKGLARQLGFQKENNSQDTSSAEPQHDKQSSATDILSMTIRGGGKIVFLGKVENSEMMRTDADKRVLLMASSTEGMPTAIAEAFSVGVPVVSTAVGDIPNVVGLTPSPNGELLPLGFTDEEYIEAILRVLENYEAYATAAYETSHLFNGKRITEGVIRDINNLIDGRE